MEACPIATTQVDENVARLTAFLVVLCCLAYGYTSTIWIAAILSLDFFLRGFLKGKASILLIVAKALAHVIKLPKHPTNAGPKQFAAKLGFLMSGAITTTRILHLPSLSLAICGILGVCAFLESAFALCIACKIYGFVLPKLPSSSSLT